MKTGEKKSIGYPLITSRKNPLVRSAALLGSSAAARRESRAFLCEGARLCGDVARSGLAIATCFFTAGAWEKYGPYLTEVLAACGEAYQVEEHVAALLSGTRNTQGVFCVCRWPGTLQEGIIGFAPARSCLVLEDLQDPGNLGTILRTAEALGIGLVFLLGDCCDPLSPKALRASMGAVFRAVLIREPSPQRLTELLKEHGYVLHAAVPDNGTRKITEVDFAKGFHAVFIGNEGNGLRLETRGLCHDEVTIPMAGRAESLNAAAAATILLWEMRRGTEKKEG